MKWLREFGQFVRDMFHHWVGVMTGLLSVLLAVTPLVFPKSFEGQSGLLHNRWQWWAAAAISFLVASRAAWDEQKEARIKSEAELRTANAKLREIEEAKPCITLRDLYTEVVHVTHNGMIVGAANVLRLKLENTARNHYPNNDARGVIARISFFDLSGNLLISDMDGRWTDSPAPQLIGPQRQSVVPYLETDFRIGARHDLDIAFLDVTYTEMNTGFVALNNDNFRFERWRDPKHLLVGERFVAKIRLSAVWVDAEFSLEFWSMPHGVIGFRVV